MNWFYQDNSRKLHFGGKKGPSSQMGTTNVCMKTHPKRHYVRVYDFSCITSLSFNWYQESKRLHPVFYLYTASLLTPKIQTVNSTTTIPLQARWWCYTPLIPALQGEGAASGQRQADICNFEPPLVYKRSSRTDSKATDKLSWGWGIPIQIVHKSLTFPKCVKIYTISYQENCFIQSYYKVCD